MSISAWCICTPTRYAVNTFFTTININYLYRFNSVYFTHCKEELFSRDQIQSILLFKNKPVCKRVIFVCNRYKVVKIYKYPSPLTDTARILNLSEKKIIRNNCCLTRISSQMKRKWTMLTQTVNCPLQFLSHPCQIKHKTLFLKFELNAFSNRGDISFEKKKFIKKVNL